MSKYRVTVLTPIHISSGNEYELNYNLLEDNGYVYIYDEFKIVELFIANGVAIPNSLDKLKNLVQEHRKKIISSNLHNRKIKSSFSNFTKPLLEHVSTANRVIVTGSSLKGAIRTAILDCLVKDNRECQYIKLLCKKDKTFDKNRFQKRFDNDLASIFKYLKVSDSSDYLKTEVYKTINVKKNRQYQYSRVDKVEEIANYIEAISSEQTFFVEIKDTHQDAIFSNLGVVNNHFYLSFLEKDIKHYSTKNFIDKRVLKSLSNNKFLINVGKFSGAELKSLNSLREIKMVKDYDKSKTTARTFGLNTPIKDRVYFENSLVPFGWLLFEKIEKLNATSNTKKILEEQKVRFEAIDTIANKIAQRERKAKEEAIKKQKVKEQEEKQKAEAKAKREEVLAKMSPIERKLDELIQNDKANTPKTTLLLNAIKNDIFKDKRLEALNLLKELLIKEKKWKEKSTAKKPQKDKNYQRTLQVMKMIEELK